METAAPDQSVPGVVAGIFTVHRERCRLAIADIIAPAVRQARDGVLFNEFQNYISHILLPILQSSPAALALVTVPEAPDQIAPQGSLLRNPDLADTLEALAREGGELFYQGELARRLASDCADHGGMLTLKDLSAYRVEIRKAVRFSSHGVEFVLNSSPSPSGSLVAFTLAMLEQVDFKDRAWGSRRHCLSIANAMRAASQLRKQSGMGRHPDPVAMETVLLPENLRQWRELAMPAALCTRGTTHLSVADAEGNLASLSVSNGEGCAYVLPGTGIMMNNMLGEEDLSPGGFHQWPVNRRMASMMCPAIARAPDGGSVALGSGGSNRIRSAIMQVLVNLFELGMPLERAVTAPRMHLEGDHLSMEHGFPDESLSALTEIWPDHRIWPEPNLFFGGVHAVERSADGRFRGAGDPRRGGSVGRGRHTDG